MVVIVKKKRVAVIVKVLIMIKVRVNLTGKVGVIKSNMKIINQLIH